MLPSFLALLACDAVWVSDFLFTATVVLVVVAADVDVDVVDELDGGLTDDIMGFIVVVDTGFTDAISTFSAALSAMLLNTEYKQIHFIFMFQPEC